ncbi:hypothetical protein GCM10009557_46840 [Virgisporangium ochraceum]|uniref:Uncharacterized protein n=1 Tax=Virgisporangium ochraceum TaxID=65505 RepID=A0A8J4EDK7_9ACTN|nr:hypothetical protein [Virgisporangium ochraceum]GIJ71650.1 hypothetical protein Voc01_065670 [Virgisporangium ochraceum]
MSESTTIQLPPVPPDGGSPEPPPHRRWIRVALITALAVLLVAAPLALYLLLNGEDSGGSGGGGPVPSEVPSASAVPSGQPSATTGVPAPDGRISPDVLRNATIDVPAWPTDNLTGLSGRVAFHNGQVLIPPDSRFPFERHMVIGAVTYGDLDRDGATETVVQISAVIQGGGVQLVALDRNRAGAIVTMGTVVAATGAIRDIDGAAGRVTGDGVVEARVADFQRCCGDETPQTWQKRGYTWDGSRFRQTTGPVSFPPNPSVTETGFDAGELVFGPAVDGVRHGTLTVTVRHVRGTRPHHLVLLFEPAPGIERDGSSWPPVQVAPNGHLTVELPTPATGASATYTFAFRRPATATDDEFGLDLRGATAGGVLLSESNPWDGQHRVTVRTTD